MASKSAWVVFAMAAVLVRGALAVDVTCGSCSNACCQWAFAAELAARNGVPSLEAHSRWTFELYGFEPIPCRDVLGDGRAYDRCASRAFFRCVDQNCCKFNKRPKVSFRDQAGSFGNVLKPDRPLGDPQFYESLNKQLSKIRFEDKWQEYTRRGVSGAAPVRFQPGQVIVLEKVDGRWMEIDAF